MTYTLLELLHTPSGKTYYCYEHWPREGGCYSAVTDIPSHKTQVVTELPISECVIKAVLPDPLFNFPEDSNEL